MEFLSVIAFFIRVCLVLIKSSHAQESCHNAPGDVRGQCLELDSCPSLTAITRLRPLPTEVIKTLNDTSCGFVAGVKKPKHCCPLTTEATQEETSTSDIADEEIVSRAATDINGTQVSNKLLARSSNSTRPQIPAQNIKHWEISNNPQPARKPWDHQETRRELLLPLATCGYRKVSVLNRIIRGKTASLASHPWIAHIGYNTPMGLQYQCGGSLVSDRYVLTAAHCIVMENNPNLRPSTVRLGEHDMSRPIDCEQRSWFQTKCSPAPQIIRVERAITHPRYVVYRFDNDIGLLRLDRRADLSTESVQPICLPVGSLQSKLYLNTRLTVAGWGKTERGFDSRVLLDAQIPVMDLSRCQRFHGTTVTNAQICAGGGLQDSCNGDSGGPLMATDLVQGIHRTVLVGVVSFGSRPCGVVGNPSVYTRVGHFLPWILQNMAL